MEVNMIQKKKHLLLLNRIMRTELKKDIIPTPSKLPEEEVNKYFMRLFVKKDDYYVPVKSKVNIKIDEELFKGLIKKPKMKEVKETEQPKENEVEKTKEEQIKEYYEVFNLYNYDYIFDNFSKIYNSLKTKKSIPFESLKVSYRDKKGEMFKEFSNRKAYLDQLLTIKKLNVFLDGMKKYKQKKDEPEKTKKIEDDIKSKYEAINEKEKAFKSFKKIFKLYNSDDIYYNVLAEIAADVRDESNFFRQLKFYTREHHNWYNSKSYQREIFNELIKLNKLTEFYELIKEVDEYYKD